MSWSNKYIEIPYHDNGRDFSGVDCWGLVYLIFKQEKNIELPEYDGACYRVKSTIMQYRSNYARVEKPQAFDLVILKPAHIGLMINKKYMIHTTESTGPQVVRLNNLEWRHRIQEFRRWI